jgi:hypothetical protein
MQPSAMTAASQAPPRALLPKSYPRSPLRRGLDAGCSISQNSQTKAVPKPTTTPRKRNDRAGAVSMFNIFSGAIGIPADVVNSGLGA